ncbi:hypothetical protein NCC49_004151 [Naganishia albida]|nr:hypothetical protein NCC49_004151 [Naganishia albida]
MDPVEDQQTTPYKDWTFVDTWREMEKLLDRGKLELSESRTLASATWKPFSDPPRSCPQLTPQQVLLVLGLKRGTSVIPKSIKEARIKSNFDPDGLVLPNGEMNKLNNVPVQSKVCDDERWKVVVFSSKEQGRGFYDSGGLFEGE